MLTSSKSPMRALCATAIAKTWTVPVICMPRHMKTDTVMVSGVYKTMVLLTSMIE